MVVPRGNWCALEGLRVSAPRGGRLQRDWVMQDQESSRAAAWCYCPWRGSQVHCAEEGKALLFSSVISFSLQSCGGREGGTALGRSGEVWI